MKTPSSRKYITVNVIRRANSAMISREERSPLLLNSGYRSIVMPSREVIVAASKKAVQRHYIVNKEPAKA